MSSELERWRGPALGWWPRVTSAPTRGQLAMVHEAQFAGLRVDAEAALTARIMERAVDLDAYRRHLANGDPVLDAILTRIEVDFVDKAGRI